MTNPRFRILFLALFVAGGCAKASSSEKKPDSGSGTEPASGSSDFDIEISVPVSLFEEIVLAVDGAGASAGAVRHGTGGSDVAVGAVASIEDVAADVLRVPLGLLGQSGVSAAAARDVIARTFGPSGDFPNGNVSVPLGGTRTYLLKTLEPQGPRYLRVSSRSGQDFDALLEYFSALDQGATYVTTMTVELGGRQASRIRLYQDMGAPSASTTEIVFDGGIQRGRVTTIRAKPTAAAPAAITLSFGSLDGGVSRYAAGGYVWSLDVASSAAGLRPRYARLETGDVELFRVLAVAAAPGLGVEGSAAQEIAFLPAPAGVTNVSPSPERFSDSTYDALTREYGLAILQDPLINTICATAGKEIRDAFPEGSMPANVAALPDDICVGDAAKADVVWRGVRDACALTPFVVAGATVIDANGNAVPESIDICRIVTAESRLANAQYFARTAAGYEFLQGRTAPSERHASVAAALAQVPWEGLENLAAPTLPPATVVAVGELVVVP